MQYIGGLAGIEDDSNVYSGGEESDASSGAKYAGMNTLAGGMAEEDGAVGTGTLAGGMSDFL